MPLDIMTSHHNMESYRIMNFQILNVENKYIPWIVTLVYRMDGKTLYKKKQMICQYDVYAGLTSF